MRAYKLVKEFGEGVDRMFREMQEAGSPEPVFEQLGFMVKASIYQHQSLEKVHSQEISTSPTTEKTTEKTMESSQEVHGKFIEKFIETLQKKDREVVEIIVDNPGVTQNEMSVILSITSRAVAKRLKSMQERGIVKRVGPDKGGHWEVVFNS